MGPGTSPVIPWNVHSVFHYFINSQQNHFSSLILFLTVYDITHFYFRSECKCLLDRKSFFFLKFDVKLQIMHEKILCEQYFNFLKKFTWTFISLEYPSGLLVTPVCIIIIIIDYIIVIIIIIWKSFSDFTICIQFTTAYSIGSFRVLIVSSMITQFLHSYISSY